MIKFGLTQKKNWQRQEKNCKISEKLRFSKKTMEMLTNHYNSSAVKRALTLPLNPVFDG